VTYVTYFCLLEWKFLNSVTESSLRAITIIIINKSVHSCSGNYIFICTVKCGTDKGPVLMYQPLIYYPVMQNPYNSHCFK